MEKSALQIARAAYQPKLPKALQGPVKAVEGAATQSVGNQDEIKALFPNTYGMPVITFEAGEAKELPAFNVGVILSGGQAPGGHNVISGLFDGVKSLNQLTSSMVSSSVLVVSLTISTWRLLLKSWTNTAILVVSTSSVPDVPSLRRKTSLRRVLRFFVNSASRHLSSSVVTTQIPTLASRRILCC